MSTSGYEKFLLRFWLRFREDEHPSFCDFFRAQSKVYWALVAVALLFFAAWTVVFGWDGLLIGLLIGYLSAQLGMAVNFRRAWPVRRKYLNWQAVEAALEGTDAPHPEDAQESSRVVPSDSQTAAVGVDRCKAGWLATIDGKDSLAGKIYPNFERLLGDLGARVVIAVDVPIGLTDQYPRRCEVEARKAIAPRSSSVFSTPVREVFSLPDYHTANARHRELTGKGFSKQAYAIFPPIREVDELLRAEPVLQERLFEVHPEVCFWAANGRQPLQSTKKAIDGHRMRRDILKAVLGLDHFDGLRNQFAKKDVADDDILDALIALWTARRISAGTAARLPVQDERDAHGLLMAMWY